MNILAIDPGFDVTGWARFKTTRPKTLNEAVGALREWGRAETHPEYDDAERLASLAHQMRTVCQSCSPVVVYLELPAIAGDYGGHRGRRRSVNKLYMALGAIQASIDGPRVIGIPAIRTPKATRHELLAHAAGLMDVELPQGPRGGAREDEWDAIWLGCQALLERAPKDVLEAVRSASFRYEGPCPS